MLSSTSSHAHAAVRAAVAPHPLAGVLRACLHEVERAGLPFGLATPIGTERSYQRLLPAGDGYEAWLICWPSGSSAPLHDHGSARGLAQVVRGSLHEWRCAAGKSELTERVWTSDRAIELPYGVCHEVRNLGEEVAYSVHVYDPRLDHMTFYDRDAAGALRPLRQEQRQQW